MSLTPFPHQSAGADFLAQGGGHLLYHDPGTGKTYTAVLAALMAGESGAVLIGCPAVATGVWEAEILRSHPDARVLILTRETLGHMYGGVHDYVIITLDLPARNDAVRQSLRGLMYSHVIIDEAHYLKAPTSKRTWAWLTAPDSIVSRVPRRNRWLLTGTPTPNHAGELWPLISATDPDRINDAPYAAFCEKYCRFKMVRRGKGPPVRTIAGTDLSRAPALRAALKGWWHRVKKADVLPDLPGKLFRVVPLHIADLDPEVARLQDSIEGEKIHDAIVSGTAGMADLDGEGDSMSRFRSLISEAKAPAVAEYVAGILDEEPAVVVWFWHIAAMDVCERILRERGITTCRVDGSTPQGKRFAIAEAFQKPTGPRVFLGQIKAAGVSITLTRAAYEVFGEMSWTPAENLQAADRCERIGQKRAVRIDILAVADTLDMAVLSTHERKMREIEELCK